MDADTTTSLDQTRLRCSDAEREQTCAALHAAVGEGRLAIDEAEERLGQAYEARYRDELAALTADIPSADPAASAATGWGGVGEALRTQLAVEAAILLGRQPASWRRRIGAGVALVGPLLLLLLAVTMLLHGVWDWHDGGPGFEHDGFRGAAGTGVTGT